MSERTKPIRKRDARKYLLGKFESDYDDLELMAWSSYCKSRTCLIVTCIVIILLVFNANLAMLIINAYYYAIPIEQYTLVLFLAALLLGCLVYVIIRRTVGRDYHYWVFHFIEITSKSESYLNS